MRSSFENLRTNQNVDRRLLLRGRRRGMAVIFVLSLLSIALAVSYALLRTQATSTQIKNNVSRYVDARQAAITGMNMALRKIHESDWQGVEVPIVRQLSSSESFEIKFQTGDDSLSAGDPDYAEYPYRVTITSTGYATDIVNPLIQASHQVKAVVQLVRRAMSTPPSNWDDLQQHTVFQWSDDPVSVELPTRIEGPVRFTGRLDLCKSAPDDRKARSRYLSDLEAMRVAGSEDRRPFTGPVDLRYGENDAKTLSLLQSNLGLETNNFSGSTTDPLTHPGSVSTYRLYPGGQEYEIPKLQDEFSWVLWNVTSKPDPASNPLGIYRSTSNVYVSDGVDFEGTILVSGSQSDIRIAGDDVSFKPVKLPPLVGTNDSIQLPVAIVGDDFRVQYGSDRVSLAGLVVAWDEFEFSRGRLDMSLAVEGRILTKRLTLDSRIPWELGEDRWDDLLDDFLDQLNDEEIENPVAYFPDWVEQQENLSSKPILTIKPQSEEVTYHWPNWDEPVFVPHPDDDGLRWELIDWQDVP